MKRLGEGLMRRFGQDGSILHNPSPVEHCFGFSGADQYVIRRLLNLQEEAGFFVRNAVLPSGAKVRLVVQGNLRRIELWVNEKDSATGVVTILLSMQHGIETIDFAALIADPINTTSTVIVNTETAAWYAADGWLIPDSDPEVYLHFAGRTDARRQAGPPVTWDLSEPDGPPVVADGAHDGIYGAGASALDYLVSARPAGGYTQTLQPAQFSGLLRGMAQAMLGAGLDGAGRSARWPAGFNSSPGSAGLVQDSATGTYWACDVSAGGLRCQAMASGQATAQIAAWLHAGTITGDAAPLALAMVLSDLRPTGEPTTLLDADDMAPVYANEYSESPAEPYQLGWIWSHVGSKAAIVTHRVTNAGEASQARESALSTVEVTWEDGVPSASLVVGARYRYRARWGYHKQWVGADDGSIWLLRDGQIAIDDNSDTDPSAPIFAFWGDTGDLLPWNYYRYETSSYATSTSNGGVSGICSDSGSEITASSGIRIRRGGFGFSAPATQLYGSGTITEKTISRVPGSEQTMNGSGGGWYYNRDIWDSLVLTNSGQMPTKCFGGCGVCYPYGGTMGVGEKNKFVHRSATATAIQRETTFSTISSVQIAVYLPQSPDVIWYGMNSRGQPSGDAVVKTQEYPCKYDAAEDIYDYYTGAFKRRTLYSKAPFWWPSAGSWTTTTESAQATDEHQFRCRVLGADYDAGAWSDWDYFDQNGLDEADAQGLWAMVSPHSAIYVPYPSAPVISVNWDGDIPGNTGALAWVGGV